MPPSENDEVHYNPQSILQLAKSFPDDEKKLQKILCLIGPEGDFTTQEKGAMCDAGAIPVVVSVNRLRTETAAMVFVANLISTFGE